MAQKTYSFALNGGLDLVTPALDLKPGKLIGVVNYEPSDEGGYRRVAGYERYSGLPSPSAAAYFIVNFDQGTIEPAIEDILTGQTTGATGEILFVIVLSGSWATNDAAGFFVVFNDNEIVYQDNENLQVSAVTQAIADGASSRNSTSEQADHETYLRAAREARRADIGPVPGSGTIRGAWMYKDKVYAFRDNVAATACVLHEDSATGWLEVDLGWGIDFHTGTAAFQEGDTVTDGIATGIVVAVGVTTGTWSGGDADGRVYIKTISGTFTAIAITSESGSAICNGAQTQNTLPPGGKYEFQNYNFGGQLTTRFMWGCNGVGRAFRFDGVDFAFIHITGIPTDTPRHLKSHKKHLFLAIGSSVLHSSTGLPMEFDPITGAGEIATGDTVVGIDTQPGGVLGIFNRNSTYVLYGDDSANYQLSEYSIERGAIEYSLQNVMVPLYLDDRGIMFLNPAQEFGDFKATSISEVIDPFVQAQKDKVLSSVRIKDKNQYRLFYSDNSFLIARVSASMKITYTIGNYGRKVHAICAEENENGVEEVYFGSDDGYLYKAETGDSFDGDIIEYFMRTPFIDAKTPRQKKRWHKLTYLLDATEPPDLNFLPEFSYGNNYNPASTALNVAAGDIHTGGGYWGDAIWGEFLWDGQVVGEADAYINGVGINMSLYIRGQSNFQAQHTLQAATVHYTSRGQKR